MSLQNLSNLKPQTKWLKLWKVWNLLCATVIQHLKVAKNGDICKNRYSSLINFASNINIKIKRVAFLCSFLSKPEKLTTSKRLEARKEGWVGQSQYEVRQIQIQNKIQNTKAVLVWVNSTQIQKAGLNGASTLADSIALLVKLFEHNCQLHVLLSFCQWHLVRLWLRWTYSIIAFIFPLHNCFSIEWYSLGPDLAELAGKEFIGTGTCIFCTCPSLHSKWLTLILMLILLMLMLLILMISPI